MAPSVQAHNRSHSLLLLQKLLNLRDSASPLTLVLDNLEQSASPLIREFTSRAKVRCSHSTTSVPALFEVKSEGAIHRHEMADEKFLDLSQ